MDAKNLAELRFLGPGFNWMKIQGIIAVGMSGYNSPLPQGTTVSVTTFDPGAACMDGPLLVAEGKFHTAITTPPWFGRMAIEGKGYFSSPLPVRALAPFSPLRPTRPCGKKIHRCKQLRGIDRKAISASHLHGAVKSSRLLGYGPDLSGLRLPVRRCGPLGRDGFLRGKAEGTARCAALQPGGRRVRRSPDDAEMESHHG